MKIKAKKNQSNDLKFGLKIILIVVLISLILAAFILYFTNDYRYINFNKYINKDSEVIRKRMVKDKYFYKYLLLDKKSSELTDEEIGNLSKESILTMYNIDSLDLKSIDSDKYNILKSKNDMFNSDRVSFYIKESTLLEKLKKLYNINLKSFDIEKYFEFQKIGVSYNGKVYISLPKNIIDKDKYVIGVNSLSKEKDYFVMDFYMYGYDSNLSNSNLKELKNLIIDKRYSYINDEFILNIPISVKHKIVKFKETQLDLDFKYQIIEIENVEIVEE